ncbi:MAG: hypothetical protein HY744_11165 [Deltaproteobacteria bacterium]|nr:hypothetical protein [Deltaproteobacteria bacterium]
MVPARRQLRAACTALAVALALLAARSARAEASTWLALGGGATAWQDAGTSGLTLSPALSFDAGVGTTDEAPFVFGGLFRIQPVIEQGTDLVWLGRAATRGFMSGWFGVALDAGMYARFWGTGGAGFTGEAVLGGPLGLQLAVLGAAGSEDARAFGAVLGLDLTRLTVHRRHLLDWWPSPRPDDEIRTRSAGR